MDSAERVRPQLARQVAHWTAAARRLGALENLAAPEAWGRLEQYLGLSIRDHLRGVSRRLAHQGDAVSAALAAAHSARDVMDVRRQLLAFRRQYLRAEVTLDFYADAINSRTTTAQGGLLRACDTIAYRAMTGVLEPLGHETPVALTYIDKGLGASILKAGLRLWDGGALSVAAAIKVVRHNLARPTALVHEAGHQVSHIVGWNEELARTLDSGLASTPALAGIWSSWASEIAADAVAFVHTGYGSVLALHDVLAAEPSSVFRVVGGDPHPMSFLRIELGIEMCRLAWGAGAWDQLAAAWRTQYPPSAAPPAARALIIASMPRMPAIARLTLATPMHAFRDRALSDVVSPSRVSPRMLDEMEKKLGPALYTSPHWVWSECLRLLALSALHAGERASLPSDARELPEQWMHRLGGLMEAA
jgi:hypothetical protein